MAELDKFPKLKKQVQKVPLPRKGPLRVFGRPLEAVAKLQQKAKELGERNAIKRNLADHASRERLAAELDSLHGSGAHLHSGLIQSRAEFLRNQTGFDPHRNSGSALSLL